MTVYSMEPVDGAGVELSHVSDVKAAGGRYVHQPVTITESVQQLSTSSARNNDDDDDYLYYTEACIAVPSRLSSPRDAMLARYMLSSCACVSVRTTPVLYQNG